MTFDEIIEIFESATRQGSATDEPEGARYITISDTLAKQIVAFLREGQ